MHTHTTLGVPSSGQLAHPRVPPLLTPLRGTALHHTPLHPHLSPGAQGDTFSCKHIQQHMPMTHPPSYVFTATCVQNSAHPQGSAQPHTQAHGHTHSKTGTCACGRGRRQAHHPISPSKPGPYRAWRAKTPAVGGSWWG